MQLEILVLLKDDAGKVLAVGPLAERFREMVASFLGPSMAQLDSAFAYLTELPAPDLGAVVDPNMVTTFLEPRTAPLPEESASELVAADVPLSAAPEPAPEAPAPELVAADAPIAAAPVVSADAAAAADAPMAPGPFVPGAIVRVNVPGSPLHNARLRLREKWDVQGPPQWGCDILDGPDTGGGTSVYESCCRPE